VACIFARGVDWFNSVGTSASSGHKLFSVSGDCEKPGVYEFPFGLTVNELLEAVGGGDAKAVQVGGASGKCVARNEFERRLAFEDVPTGGSVIVIGPGRDMGAVAENLLEFFVEESCGQCTPCRLGNGKLLEGLKSLREGTVGEEYLKDLRALAGTMQVAAKCGLGQTSPSAFVSIMDNFEDEVLGRKAVS
jgi:[NiFe] hydrogenase diaphorase moiety large subunit